MSLQRKFTLLLLLMVMTVAVNAAATVWAVRVLDDQFARPIRTVQSVLHLLHDTKRRLGELSIVVGAEHPAIGPGIPETPDEPPSARDAGAEAPDRRARYDALSARIESNLAALESIEGYRRLTGAAATATFGRRVRAGVGIAETALVAADAPSLRNAAEALVNLHELIEHTEGLILGTAGMTLDYKDTVEASVRRVVVISMLWVGAALLLGLVLVRRWVLTPVASLRRAAERIALGDYAHRVPVRGGDELGLLSAEVNAMAETIGTMQQERAERERLAAMGEMVRRITHNLRNPLSGIRIVSEVTRQGLPPESPLRENLDRIVQSVDRLDAWITDLMSASRPLAVVPARQALRPMIERVLDAHRTTAAGRRVALLVLDEGAPTEACFDDKHLGHALSAIIANAIEFSPPGAEVRVRLQPGERGGVVISVEDQGPGVPDDLRERIFQAYFTTKASGSGIGLAVANEVVRLHGGRIDVESPVRGAERGPFGPGAAFRVCLPASAGR